MRRDNWRADTPIYAHYCQQCGDPVRRAIDGDWICHRCWTRQQRRAECLAHAAETVAAEAEHKAYQQALMEVKAYAAELSAGHVATIEFDVYHRRGVPAYYRLNYRKGRDIVRGERHCLRLSEALDAARALLWSGATDVRIVEG
jgi:ribosomal protein L37AE/L43A